MINLLGGDKESVEAFQKCVGKVISHLVLKGDDLIFTFEDGERMKLSDDGQSCCELRYMRTDDDLSYFIGSKLQGSEVVDAPDIQDGGESHEVQFLHITTSKGTFTMSSHNEHNGYYGGFSIRAQLLNKN